MLKGEKEDRKEGKKERKKEGWKEGKRKEWKGGEENIKWQSSILLYGVGNE
jgi:hypothetical protein